MGVAAAVGAAAIWACTAALMGSQARRLDSITISGVRAVCAGVFFVALVFAAGKGGEVAGMSAWTIAQLSLSALIGLTLGDTLYVMSIATLGMNRAYPIGIGLWTFFAFVLSAVLLDEHVGLATVVGAALVLLGVYVVATRGRADAARAAPLEPVVEELAPTPVVEDPLPVIAGGAVDAPPASEILPAGPAPLAAVAPRSVATGLACIAVAGLFWAIATVWLRDAAAGFDAIAVGAVRIPTAAVLLGSAAFAYRPSAVRRRTVPRRSLGILAIAGIAGTGVAGLLFIYAVQEAGAGKTAVLSSMSPLFALPIGALFLGERITRWLAAGTALAVTGVVLLA